MGPKNNICVKIAQLRFAGLADEEIVEQTNCDPEWIYADEVEDVLDDMWNLKFQLEFKTFIPRSYI